MARTVTVEVLKGEWTEMDIDGTYAAIQLNEKGAIKVHVSDGTPPDDNEVGIYIARAQTGTPGTFAMGGIPTGVKIFVRSAQDETETIVFLSY